MKNRKIAKIIEVWPGAHENENRVVDAGLKIEYNGNIYVVEVIFANFPGERNNYPENFQPTLLNVKTLRGKEIEFEFLNDVGGVLRIKIDKILENKNEN